MLESSNTKGSQKVKSHLTGFTVEWEEHGLWNQTSVGIFSLSKFSL